MKTSKYFRFKIWIVFYLLIPEINIQLVEKSSTLKKIYIIEFKCIYFRQLLFFL